MLAYFFFISLLYFKIIDSIIQKHFLIALFNAAQFIWAPQVRPIKIHFKGYWLCGL